MTSPDQRIDQLERLVEVLMGEVKELRREVRLSNARQRTTGSEPEAAGRPAAGPFTLPPASTALPPTPPPPPPGPRPTIAPDPVPPTPRRSFLTGEDLERLVGRYGMLALATITGLAAVGTFIGWAASRAQLGPEARLSLGLLLAALLAGSGIRIRRREHSFGAVLLGLALAVAHVCAWGAGPAVLGVVPSELTLTLALLASTALAAFAHRENDQPLWCVGFGGAAIAPFVTSSGSASPFALMLYGGAVMLLGCWALRGREWPIAGRVLTLAGMAYTLALIAAPEETGAPLMALGLATIVAGAGVIPFTGLAMRRSRLRGFGVMMALAAADVSNFAATGVEGTDLAAIVLALVAWAAYLDMTADLPAGSLLDGLVGEGSGIWDFVDAAAIPLVFLTALFDAVAGPDWHDGLAAAFTALVMLVFAFRRSVSPLRDASVLAVCVASLLAAWWLTDDAGDWTIAIMAVPAVGFIQLRNMLPARPWMPLAAMTLVVCSIAAFFTLTDRAQYGYLPFATTESFVALAVLLAWIMGWIIAAGDRKPLGIAAWMWAFAWVHQELYAAISPVTSTLLIISYYAVTSVVLVGVGRSRASPELRHVGLVLALVAAAAAVRGAMNLETVWAQIAGYLVASVFLLGIAWWYRQRDDMGVSAGAEQPS